MQRRPGAWFDQRVTAADLAPLLRLDALHVGYGLPICPPVSLTVEPGDVVVIVGANGTGKSTLLRTVVGLLKPLAGRAEVMGAPVDDRTRAFRRHVAVELGEEAFFPTLTTREHLLLTCVGHGVADPEAVVDAQLDDFGLVERADALPAALSSGQRRRLLLASVFARPRSLMILDEPEQRLDTSMRQRLGEFLIEERDGGGGVLMASHDPRLVAQVATTVVALSERAVEVLDAARAAELIRHER